MIRSTLLLSALALTGCGGPEVERVAGSVLLNGNPEDRLVVCLWPLDNPKHGILTGPTNARGEYDIAPKPDQGQKGKKGRYAIVVYDHVPISRFPGKFCDPKRTPHRVTLDRGFNEVDDIDLPLDTSAPKSLILQKLLEVPGS